MMIESFAEAIAMGSCVKTPARRACKVVNEERSAWALREGGDPSADATQAQVVPHLEQGAGQLLAGVHDDEFVGQLGVAPHLVVAVVVGVGAFA